LRILDPAPGAASAEDVTLTLEAVDAGGGVGDVRCQNVTSPRDQPGVPTEPLDGGRYRCQVRLAAGENQLAVTATSRAGVASLPAFVTVHRR
jgi:hypothetical protein